jgi:hypothetical protein
VKSDLKWVYKAIMFNCVEEYRFEAITCAATAECPSNIHEKVVAIAFSGDDDSIPA